MRFDVDTEALRKGADAVHEALSHVEHLRLADHVGRLGVAIPGGRSAGATWQVCLAGQARLSETAWLMKSLGGRLAEAAEAYAMVETMAQRALQRSRSPHAVAALHGGTAGGPGLDPS